MQRSHVETSPSIITLQMLFLILSETDPVAG